MAKGNEKAANLAVTFVGIKEGESATHNDDERFDNDIVLMTGELSKMLADIVEALGGEAKA